MSQKSKYDLILKSEIVLTKWLNIFFILIYIIGIFGGYFLVGTLASFSFAIICGLFLKFVFLKS